MTGLARRKRSGGRGKAAAAAGARRPKGGRRTKGSRTRSGSAAPGSASRKRGIPAHRNTVRVTQAATKNLRAEIIQYMDSDGYLSWSSKKKKYQILGTNTPKDGLVACPECGVGQLVVIRSPKTRKRFIGCSNYHNGCKASSPLLQRAMLRVTKVPCRACSWPVVVFRFARTQPWTKRCSNIDCAHRDPAGGGGGSASKP